jgi:hypothetical protein
MRLPVQLGQMLRLPQEKATSRSWPHASQCARTKPCEKSLCVATHNDFYALVVVMRGFVRKSVCSGHGSAKDSA